MRKVAEFHNAKNLYMTTDMTQKDIAARVKVTEKTIHDWIEGHGWEAQKVAATVTRESLLASSYKQLKALNDQVSEQGGLLNKQQSDAKGVLVKEIQVLDKGEPLSMYISVMEKFLTFLTTRDQELARNVANYQLQFIEHKSSEIA